ncbi:MAG: hypothetical protein ACYTFY_13315, partial [Planctomycetota bacterium]
ASAEIEFRCENPKPLEEITEKLNTLIDNKEEKEIDISLSLTGKRPAAKAVMPERFESFIKDTLKSLGIEAEEKAMSTNINATLAARWPSLSTGLYSKGEGHTDNDFIIIDSLDKGWQYLLSIAEHYLLLK